MADDRAHVIGLTGVTGRLGRKVLDRVVLAGSPMVLLAAPRPSGRALELGAAPV
jgi:hypothetical protein